MAQSSIVVQLDPEVQARLAALAEDRHQPLSEVAADVISTYLAPDSWEHRRIREGLAEFEAGRGISHDRVVDWLDGWGTENERPAPQ